MPWVIKHLGMNLYMVTILMLFTYPSWSQDNIPYEDKENYKFELDYDFKSRPLLEKGHAEFKQRSKSNLLLPYVKVSLTFINISEGYYKVKIINNFGDNVLSKKIKQNMKVIVDMGYADDIKDRTGPHHYEIYFVNKSKVKVSKITLNIDEEGNFKVNNSPFGKI